MTAANRGKYAEAKVRGHLKRLDAQLANFTFNRISDAHSAGGRAQPQPGDFQAFMSGTYNVVATSAGVDLLWSQHPDGAPANRNFLIEVKEVKHDYRLPHQNYSPDSVARMAKRALAGSEPVVLVYHTEAEVWRCVPFDVFQTRTGGSWDLRPYPPVDYREALNNAFGVKP